MDSPPIEEESLKIDFKKLCDISKQEIENGSTQNVVVQVSKMFPGTERWRNMVLTDYTAPKHKKAPELRHTFQCVVFRDFMQVLNKRNIQEGNFLYIRNLTVKFYNDLVDAKFETRNSPQLHILERDHPAVEQLLERKERFSRDGELEEGTEGTETPGQENPPVENSSKRRLEDKDINEPNTILRKSVYEPSSLLTPISSQSKSKIDKENDSLNGSISKKARGHLSAINISFKDLRHNFDYDSDDDPFED